MVDLRVQGTTIPARRTGDGNIEVQGLRDGSLRVADWKQALALEGRAFIMQLGTEDAPIASTTSIDDALVWGVIDVASGTTALLYHAEAVIATWTTATLVNMMIEYDNAKVRYTSGGTAFTPLGLRTDAPIASTSAAYVGTDVTVAAKSTGGSLEVYRQSVEVNLGDAADSAPMWEYNPVVLEPVVGPASILFHFGAASADVTAYGNMKWLEVPTNSIN